MPPKTRTSPRRKAIPDDIPASMVEVKNDDEVLKSPIKPSQTAADIRDTSSSDRGSRYSIGGETLTEAPGALTIDVAASPLKGTKPALAELDEHGKPLNQGRTQLIMSILRFAWIFNALIIGGATYALTFWIPQGYVDDEYWNKGCYWKMGWLLPLPYTFICFLGLIMPYSKAIRPDPYQKGNPRRIDNLYILTVTKGDNKEAVMRAWNAHKHLTKYDPCIRVHVLTDEPNHFDGINCFTCPKAFTTDRAKYKARALEWYRKAMQYTEHDWVLHLDEESVIDDETVSRCLDFIRYAKDCTWGQGVIMYNQHRFWKNPIFTVADALRVGDDLSRFHLQYWLFQRPIFGAHGSFLLTNGKVENDVTWDLGSLTEDFQFAVTAWKRGYICGEIPGIVREQSPMGLVGFLKQRRRWFVGIRRLPAFLPKLLAFFWALGLISLYSTIASIVLGFEVPTNTPRWFGGLKDFSLVVFVYLYVYGMVIQNLDKGYNFVLQILAIPVTAVLQFVAVILEAVAVMYAIVSPPKGFDVIKK